MAPDLDGSDEPGAVTNETAEDAPYDTAPSAIAVPALTRVRVLTFAALGSLLTGYAAIAALLALVTAIATKAHFATVGVLGAALPSWLAAHQVPVSIFGLELGALPLLPTIGVVAITAKAASSAAERLDLHRPGQSVSMIVTIACAHGIAGVLIAGFTSDEQVTVDPLAAFYYPTLVAGLAATVGVARRCGLLDAIVDRADGVAVAGLRAGALAVVLLLATGGAVLTFGLLTSISTARDLFPMGVGNALGMLLLSIGYLPNAMVAATSFVAGPGFSLGDVAVSPIEFSGGPVPGLPLLAAMPEQHAPWWPALFLLPLTVGIVVGRRLRDVDEDPVARLRGVAVAAGVVAVCFVVLAGSAGGRLGRGAFDPVSMRAAALSITLVLWTALPAAVTAWFSGPRAATERMPGLIDDDADHIAPEPEPNADDLDDVEAEDSPAEAETEEDAEAEEEPEEEPEDEPDEEPDRATELPGPRDAMEESGEVARD